jgi:hypothetical protein
MKFSVSFNIYYLATIAAILVGVLGLALASKANAQEDIPLPPDSSTGEYTMKVMPQQEGENNAAVHVACCDRVDVSPPIELGCGPRAETDPITFTVAVVKTPGDPAEVRCRVLNPDFSSDYSSNAYLLSFPSKPDIPVLQ